VSGEDTVRVRWLPPFLRPPIPLQRRQALIFLLVGTTLLFSGYDLNIFGLALPQIQSELHIPENAAGLTVSYFRLAALAALLIAPLADIFGRRRLLLFTVFGEAILTVASAFTHTYLQFVLCQIAARVFGYCEEMLCFVVIAEEIDARARGWSSGALFALNGTGAGLSALVFAAVDYLPFGWRALYFIGGGALLILAYFRRWLPETTRFEIRRKEIAALGSKTRVASEMIGRLLREFPGRLTALLIAVASAGFAFAPAVILMSKYLQETHHYRPFQVTILYIGGGLLSVLGVIFAGRLSDSLGRKRVLLAMVILGGASFGVLYSGIGGSIVAIAWILAIFGYLSAEALFSGYPAEIFPTAYRATTSTLRYVAAILGGALSLALEGVFFDRFGAHGPAVMLFLAAAPVAVIAVLFLPETARRTLEDIAEEPLEAREA
jgi:MFS family permease